MAKGTKEVTEVTQEEKIAALEAKVKEQQDSLIELNEINVALENKLEEQELLLSKSAVPVVKEKKKSAIPSKSFKVDGEEHVFIVPQFTNPLNGHTVITAEEALKEKDLLDHLVKNDCGVTKRKDS